MSAQAKKIIHFPESPARAELSACAQPRAGNEPMPLNNPFRQCLPKLPACRRREGAIGLGAASPCAACRSRGSCQCGSNTKDKMIPRCNF